MPWPRAALGLAARATLPSVAVILVGLTGGIGSGKSTVSAHLAARGAHIVDADGLVRELQAPGSPVLAEMAECFGAHILRDDGSLDRQAVADVVFNDPQALDALNGIMGPAVIGAIRRRIEALLGTDHVVVLDIPLWVPGRYPVTGLVVVDTPPDVAVERLVRFRGLREDDARARIGRQVGRDERLGWADHVVDNAGPPEALDAQMDGLWAWVCSQAPADGLVGPWGAELDAKMAERAAKQAAAAAAESNSRSGG